MANNDRALTTINKVVTGFITLCLTVSVAMGGWALKQGYEANIDLNTVKVEQANMKATINGNSKNIDKLESTDVLMKVQAEKIKNIEEDIDEIKELLKNMKR